MSDEINEDALSQIKELMGDKFAMLIDTYVMSTKAHLVKLRAGLDAGDVKMIVDSAHPMKSSAGNMGLAKLSEVAAQLEKEANVLVQNGGDVLVLENLVYQIEVLFQSGEAFLRQQ